MKRIFRRLQSVAAWIARHELWPTSIGVFLATVSLRYALWGLGLLAALWLIRRVGDRRWSLATPVDWPIGILVGMGAISWLITVDRAATALALGRLLAGVALLYSIVNWAKTSARLLLILWGMTLCALLLALVTPMVIPRQNIPSFPAIYNRLPQLPYRLNSNMMAGALVMLLPFPLAGSTLLWRRTLTALPHAHATQNGLKALQFWRVVSMPAAGLMGGALLFTQSRGAWMAAGGVLCIICVGYSPLFLGILLLPMLAGGWLVWQGRLPNFLNALGSGGGIAGWPQRVEIWSRALYILQDFPFTGLGADTFPSATKTLYPLFLVTPTTVIPHAHNLYLQAGIDLGIPGLIAFLAIVLTALFSAMRGLHVHADDPVRRVALWAGLASLGAMLLHGMVDATTWIVGWAAPLPWLVIGLLLAATCSPTPSSIQ